MENGKKLERDTQHKVIGGVCSGLANYFNIDVSLLRILVACLILFAGAGFWVYIILWLVMPAATLGQTSNETSQFVAEEVPDASPKGKGSLVFGLILIGIGALGLLHRFVPEFNWQMIWPLALIVLGVFLLFPSKNK